jgi:hypothetical protein
LKDFGLETPEQLKAKLDKLNELETAQLSEKERTEKTINELKPKAEAADRISALFGSMVDAQFTALPEKVQTAIDKTANGSAEARWTAMQTMAEAGLITMAMPSAQPQTPAAPAPKPASTTPAGAPPPPAPGAGPKSAFDTWNDLKKTDTVRASLFYQTNAQSIEQSRPSSAGA